jgi:hypothetical protein
LSEPLVPNTFARLDHRELRFPTAVLWARRDILAGRAGARRLGFLDLGAVSGPVELPSITTLVADVHSEHQIKLLAVKLTPGAEPMTLAEAHFHDPNPAWCSDAAQMDGRLVVRTSVRAVEAYSTIFSFLINCWAAVVPLASYPLVTSPA